MRFFLCIGLLFVLGACKNTYVRGQYDYAGWMKACTWRDPIAYGYKPKQPWLDSLRTLRNAPPADVVIFTGTWCNTSEKYVPRFLVFAPELPLGKLTFVSMDTTKQDADGLAQRYGIELIPTFVFERNGQEIGRITEKPPKRQLEKAVFEILKR